MQVSNIEVVVSSEVTESFAAADTASTAATIRFTELLVVGGGSTIGDW